MGNNYVLTLTNQQIIWLKDLIRADISDWENMSSGPVDEVGVKFAHLAKVRIENMKAILLKLDAVQAVDTLCKVHESGLMPEIVFRFDDILAVVLND